ncbi:lytic transglycosylase domain-containing protein [Helicobacter cynogastricus]|uniref:lytic transglycosylase domain-containing protein n=1 Tax=Helicobacter cynogastricus TaxID=329937 RepID=UPI000CF0D0A1|nr:lytic transglycosylase domain-containing protein [Helicobacter cynogastricus]
MVRILCLLGLVCVLGAQEISLAFLKSKPPGIARDFYIWLFLKNPNTTTQDAKAVYPLVQRNSVAIQEAMRAKKALTLGPTNLCVHLPLKELALKDASCIALGLKITRVFEAVKNHSQRTLLETMRTKLTKEHVKLSTSIGILLSHDLLKELFSTTASTLAFIYNALPYEQRLQLLDHHISAKLLEKSLNQNNFSLNQIIQRIIFDSRFLHFKKSLAQANIVNSDDKTFFALGLNAVMHGKYEKALDYFKRTAYQASSAFLKDKALFWQYLVSQDKATLETLSQSPNPNLFSLYARLNLKKKLDYKLVTSLPISHKKPPFDITDPFAWQIFRDKTLALKNKNQLHQRLESLKTPTTLPHLAYFLSLYNSDQHYFLTPYENIIAWSSLQEKSLAYAIARQESLLLPALISRSYALGLMQIMPFNVDHFAKQMGVGATKLTDMFNPTIALPFGNHYLNFLKQEFKHPLFVAYCYNAGPGFFRRLLQERHFFRRGHFEPWLSMELIPYEETRLYGQKVMANYILYQWVLNPKAKPFDIDNFFSTTLQTRR